MEKLRIKLPGQLDMAALTALKEDLINTTNITNSLAIDGSEVERVGTPAIQLLLAAAKAFSAEGRSFALETPSQALSLALDDLGLGIDVRQWSTP